MSCIQIGEDREFGIWNSHPTSRAISSPAVYAIFNACRAFQIPNSKFLILPPCHRQIALRIGEARLELQRLLELPDGFIEVAVRPERDAEVVVRFRGIRRQA